MSNHCPLILKHYLYYILKHPSIDNEYYASTKLNQIVIETVIQLENCNQNSKKYDRLFLYRNEIVEILHTMLLY